MKWLFTEQTDDESSFLVVMYDLKNKKDVQYAKEHVRFIEKRELLMIEQQNLRSVKNKLAMAQHNFVPKYDWVEPSCKT